MPGVLEHLAKGLEYFLYGRPLVGKEFHGIHAVDHGTAVRFKNQQSSILQFGSIQHHVVQTQRTVHQSQGVGLT